MIGPIANAPGLVFDFMSRRWKRSDGGSGHVHLDETSGRAHVNEWRPKSGRDAEPGFLKHVNKPLHEQAERMNAALGHYRAGHLELKHSKTNHHAVVIPDASEPGRWRYSEYDEHGFSSHSTHDTPLQAAAAAGDAGFTEPAPGSLDRLSGTETWAKGTRSAKVVQLANGLRNNDLAHAVHSHYARHGWSEAAHDRIMHPDVLASLRAGKVHPELLKAIAERRSSRMSIFALTWTAEAAKALQLGLFNPMAGQSGGDHSRGGRLVKEIRVHSNGKRVTHWVLRPSAEPDAPAPRHRDEGERAASRVEPAEGKVRFELKADVTRMWQMEAKSAYAGILPVIAVREAAQNGLDAVRKAMKAGQVTEGRFDVVFDTEADTLTISDNGVGMDLNTLNDKFLTLGATGKSDDPTAVGGFGVAKAAILGSVDIENGGGWQIHTRDVRLSNTQLAQDLDPDEVRAEYRQGTQLILRKPELSYWNRRELEGATVELLASSDLGAGIAATWNGKTVRPMWSGKRGKVVNFSGIEWPEGVKVTVTRFRVPDGAARQGKVYVRTGGLTQFSDSFYANKGSEHDYVIDLGITARPGTPEYPLNKARQGFQGSANYAFRDVVSAIEKELQKDNSAKREQEWEDFSVDADGVIKTSTGAQMIDEEPDDIADLLTNMGGAAALLELAEIVRGVAGPETAAKPRRGAWADTPAPEPGDWTDSSTSVLGTLVKAVAEAGGDVSRIVSRVTEADADAALQMVSGQEIEGNGFDTPQKHGITGQTTTTSVKVIGGEHHGKIQHVERETLDHIIAMRTDGIHDLPHHGGEVIVTPAEHAALQEHARDAWSRGEEHSRSYYRALKEGTENEEGAQYQDVALSDTAVNAHLRTLRGMAPTAAPKKQEDAVAVGGREARGNIDNSDTVREVHSDTVRGIKGQVRTGLPFSISRNNASWPKRRKLNMKKVAPGLLAWDSIVRATASAAGLNDRISTGLVLDPGVYGQNASKGGVNCIYINPDHLMEWLGPKNDPVTAAVKLHGLAVHEMAHNAYDKHDEDYSIQRETLHKKTAHLIPVLTAIVEKITGRRSAGSAERDKLAKGLEKAKATAATQRAEHTKRVKSLEAEVARLQKMAPPPKAEEPTAPAQAPKRDIFAEAGHELAERRGMVKGLHAAGITEFRHHSRENYAALGADPSKPGRFRTTRYDADGMAGHSEHASIGDALHHLARDGYVHPAAGSMDRLVSAAPPAPGSMSPHHAIDEQMTRQTSRASVAGPTPKRRGKPESTDQLGFGFKAVGGILNNMIGALRIYRLDLARKDNRAIP